MDNFLIQESNGGVEGPTEKKCGREQKGSHCICREAGGNVENVYVRRGTGIQRDDG